MTIKDIDEEKIKLLETYVSYDIERKIGVLKKRLKGETLANIGKYYNVGKERIRQIQEGAISDITMLLKEDKTSLYVRRKLLLFRNKNK